jgi:hypothetical protein
MITRIHAYLSTSCAGLTRASITLQKDSREEMDCRVKPGNDGTVIQDRLAGSAGCGQVRHRHKPA